MPGRRDHLQLIGGRRIWVRPQPRMQVATQAIFAGPQEHRVIAMTPQATGRGYGHIAVRVGRVLVYLEDRKALEAWTTAIGKADDLADSAFGHLPKSRYEVAGSSGMAGVRSKGSGHGPLHAPLRRGQPRTSPVHGEAFPRERCGAVAEATPRRRWLRAGSASRAFSCRCHRKSPTRRTETWPFSGGQAVNAAGSGTPLAARSGALASWPS